MRNSRSLRASSWTTRTTSILHLQQGHQNVRKVIAATGNITTLAGSGINTGGSPYGVAVGASGRIFFTDEGNNMVTLGYLVE